MSTRAAPRAVHPVAWWTWAIGLAAAASRTLNPVLLLTILAVVGLVVAARKSDAPWSASFRAFLLFGLVALAFRLLFEVVFGPPLPGTVLFTLPSVTLPEVMAGARLGGVVTLPAVVAALWSGLQLVVIFACIGAANALANPTRLLKSAPGSLYEVGVAVVVAVTLIPTAITHARSLREARRLRGRTDRGLRATSSIAVSVLEGSLERSLDLAAAMDSRGYGRMRPVPVAQRRLTSALMLTGLVAILVGSYGLLDAQTPAWASFTTLAAGAAVAVFGIRRANRRSLRTVYRPDPWRAAEWTTVLTGLIPVLAVTLAGSVAPTVLVPAVTPLTWPAAPLVLVGAIVLAALPAWLTPPPPSAREETHRDVGNADVPVRLAA